LARERRRLAGERVEALGRLLLCFEVVCVLVLGVPAVLGAQEPAFVGGLELL